MNWDVVIGLEVHAQLRTQTKLFCGCAVAFGGAPNTRVCPVCLGMPGVLPVLNEHAVELAARAGLALGCDVQGASIFARKNYFYPDLPKGYQISQYDRPFALGGSVRLDAEHAVRLTRIHMEEDAGKLVHGEASYVDLNRAGVPLIEVVSEPEITSPQQAGSYLRALRSSLVYLGVSNADMEKGEFRCDANISLKPAGATELGTRVELKNMNSFRFIEQALEYEIDRQRAELDNGAEIIQETRLWSQERLVTAPMRSKEEAHDYRYFPEPDLLPLRLEPAQLRAWADALPETGFDKAARYETELRLPAYDAGVLTAEPEIAAFFEAVVEAGAEPKAASNWVMSEVMATSVTELRFSAADLADLLKLISTGTISGKIAKDVFAQMVETGRSPQEIVEEQGLQQISDPAEIESHVDRVLKDNPDKVEQYRAGKHKLFGFFVGQVMKATQGAANPRVVNEVLESRLGAEEE